MERFNGCTVEFVYNGKRRFGVVDKVGKGPNGEYITVNFDGSFKSFSVEKIEGFVSMGLVAK